MTDHKAEPMRGRLIEADFGKDTVTFRMEPPYYVSSGEFLISPIGGGISLDSLTAAPAASEGEDGAVAWQYRRQPEEPWEPVDRYSVRALVGDGDEYRPLYTRPSAQVAATPKHDEGRDSLTYAEQRKVVEYMTTELGAAISILHKVQQRAEAIDCQPLATQPAARRVTDAERLLTNLVDDVFSLINESTGVYGLHLNGDPSPWEELLPGSRFERFSTLNDALKLVESFAQPAEGVSGG